MQKWCMECGEESRPIPAVTVVDGDPLCAVHAQLRGASVEVQTKPVERPVAVKENKTVDKACACGCGEIVSGSWNYKRGHKPQAGKVKSGGGNTPKHSVAAPEVPAGNFLDLVWAAMPVELKKAALRSLL